MESSSSHSPTIVVLLFGLLLMLFFSSQTCDGRITNVIMESQSQHSSMGLGDSWVRSTSGSHLYTVYRRSGVPPPPAPAYARTRRQYPAPPPPVNWSSRGQDQTYVFSIFPLGPCFGWCFFSDSFNRCNLFSLINKFSLPIKKKKKLMFFHVHVLDKLSEMFPRFSKIFRENSSCILLSLVSFWWLWLLTASCFPFCWLGQKISSQVWWT